MADQELQEVEEELEELEELQELQQLGFGPFHFGEPEQVVLTEWLSEYRVEVNSFEELEALPLYEQFRLFELLNFLSRYETLYVEGNRFVLLIRTVDGQENFEIDLDRSSVWTQFQTRLIVDFIIDDNLIMSRDVFVNSFDMVGIIEDHIFGDRTYTRFLFYPDIVSNNDYYSLTLIQDEERSLYQVCHLYEDYPMTVTGRSEAILLSDQYSNLLNLLHNKNEEGIFPFDAISESMSKDPGAVIQIYIKKERFFFTYYRNHVVRCYQVMGLDEAANQFRRRGIPFYGNDYLMNKITISNGLSAYPPLLADNEVVFPYEASKVKRGELERGKQEGTKYEFRNYNFYFTERKIYVEVFEKDGTITNRVIQRI